MSPTFFLVVAVLAVLASLTVVVHRSPVYSALALVVTLFLIAVLFLGLDARMVGFLQIIVYAGAIVVLFLFVIMLLNLQAEPKAMVAPALVAVAVTGGVGLAAYVLIGIRRAPALIPTLLPAELGGTVPLAERLFTTYLLPFELTSVLLLVAIIGAVVIGRKKAMP